MLIVSAASLHHALPRCCSVGHLTPLPYRIAVNGNLLSQDRHMRLTLSAIEKCLEVRYRALRIRSEMDGMISTLFKVQVVMQRASRIEGRPARRTRRPTI
jgi:hypothetical protein